MNIPLIHIRGNEKHPSLDMKHLTLNLHSKKLAKMWL